MAALQPAPTTTHEAVSASLRVVESAVALARAEAKLAAVRARTLFGDATLLVVGTLVALTFTQLTLLLVALTPLLLASSPLGAPPPWGLIASYVLALGLAGAGGTVAWRAWQRLRTPDHSQESGAS